LKDLIDLQNSHVTQITNNGNKSEWKVRQNITSMDLYTLPGTIPDKEMMAVMEFARVFEQKAFEAGIKLQKTLSTNYYEDEIKKLKYYNELAAQENTRLAEKLEKFIISKE